nr:hypothetical protein [Tanacetum cinerariifolium]
GDLPGVLPAAGGRYLQAQAGQADRPLADAKEGDRAHPRGHQHLDPELHVHAAGHQRAAGAADVGRLASDRPGKRRRLGHLFRRR